MYAALVFAAGFVLGTVRLLLLMPRLGGTGAVLLETPVILAISAWVCRRCIARFRVAAVPAARLTMGAVAFAVLMLAEAGLATGLFGQSPDDYLNALRTPPGLIGLAGQLVFAILPLLEGCRGSRDEKAGTR